jgi:large subunit ribosomal protein L10
MARPEKAAAVAEITERFQDASAALLTEYRGLHVGEIAELRGALREAGTEYKVLKNTLARIAVREVGLEELVDMLEGPTAIAFVKGDAVEAAKALDDAAKKFPVLVIKGGVVEGKIIDADQARQLAKLEPREVQLAKIVMMVNTPLQQTANVLSALLRDFGSMLAQVVSKKESGELPGGTGEQPEALAEETGAAEAADTGEAAEPVADATPEEETIENADVGPGAEADDDATDGDASDDDDSGSEEGKE